MLRACTAIARKATGLGDALAASLLECGVSQLLATQHAEPVEAASELLLVLAERFDAEAAAVTHALLKHCEAGTLAAPCVLRALADVASAAPTATVPLLKAELLPRLLPMLGQVSVWRLARSPAARAAACAHLPHLTSRPAPPQARASEARCALAYLLASFAGGVAQIADAQQNAPPPSADTPEGLPPPLTAALGFGAG